MTEYVQPASVAEHVTPVSAAPAVTYAAPSPVAESVSGFLRCRSWKKTIEIPQLQIVEKIVEIPELRTIQGTETSESFGKLLPFGQVEPAQLVEMVELGPPSSAVSSLLCS